MSLTEKRGKRSAKRLLLLRLLLLRLEARTSLLLTSSSFCETSTKASAGHRAANKLGLGNSEFFLSFNALFDYFLASTAAMASAT